MFMISSLGRPELLADQKAGQEDIRVFFPNEFYAR
jgi:hypothetical protein